MSMWLPHNLSQISAAEKIADDQQTAINGIVITPYSYNQDHILATGGNGPYGAIYPLVYGAWGKFAKGPNFIDVSPDFKDLSNRYPYKAPLFANNHIMLYSTRTVLPAKD